MDIEAVRKAISPKTKAIIPVHLYGQSVDMAPLLALAAQHNLPVIEDNAQAIGSVYTFPDGTQAKTGAIGTIGCTSFFPSKNLGCYGDGGALFTNDDALAEKIRMIANHGQKVKYYHEIVGCNSRLDTIQAAILRVKLPHLDRYNAARRQAADAYDAAFSGNPHLETPFRAPYSTHVFHQYTLKLKGVDRDAVAAALTEQGIPNMIYYPVPSHRQNMLRETGSANAALPVTEMLNKCVLSLPIHTELTKEEIDFITAAVNETVSQLAKA